MTILSLFLGAPWWVWPLFGYLVFIGIIAMQKRVVWIPLFFILPVIFGGIKIEALLHADFLLQVVFFLTLFFGLLLGGMLVLRENIFINKETYEVEVPGNRYTFFLLIFIFSVKFYAGMAHALNFNHLLLIDACETGVHGFIFGFFSGKAFLYVKRFFC